MRGLCPWSDTSSTRRNCCFVRVKLSWARTIEKPKLDSNIWISHTTCDANDPLRFWSRSDSDASDVWNRKTSEMADTCHHAGQLSDLDLYLRRRIRSFLKLIRLDRRDQYELHVAVGPESLMSPADVHHAISVLAPDPVEKWQRR